MGLRINTNVGALNALRQLLGTQGRLGAAQEKLATGLGINRASDNPSGLVISELLRSQLGGVEQAIDNTSRDSNMVQTAEAALEDAGGLVAEVRRLGVAAMNSGGLDDGQQRALQYAADSALAGLNRIAATTRFGSRQLLDGSFASGGLLFQVGEQAGDTVTAELPDVAAGALGDATTGFLSEVGAGGAADLLTDPTRAVEIADLALGQVSEARASLGALTRNVLDPNIRRLETHFENLTASESNIRDLDYGLGIANFVRERLLQDATLSVLRQSNLSQQSVLRLIG